MRRWLASQSALVIYASALAGWMLAERFPFPAPPFTRDEALVAMTATLQPLLYDALAWTWTAAMYTTPAILFSLLFSLVMVFVPVGERRAKGSKLPPFPRNDERLQLVLGEMHHPTKLQPSNDPKWMVIPDRGLYTGVAIVGLTGSGKTTATLRPYADQIFSWHADDAAKKVGGIILEVKGSFCHQVKEVLASHGRAGDYIEMSTDGGYRYNPLASEMDSYEIAYQIASIISQLYGHSKDAFWSQAYTNLVKFLIILHRVVDEYCTLFNVYTCAISMAAIQRKITEGDNLFARLNERRNYNLVLIPPRAFLADSRIQDAADWTKKGTEVQAESTPALLALLAEANVVYRIEPPEVSPEEASALADRMEQLEAVKRWFIGDWGNIDQKLRTSIVEGFTVFGSLFDSSPVLKRIFCPPKECYAGDTKHGVPLPHMSNLIEEGKVLALNFPMASNPAVSRAIATFLKLEYQRVMQLRIPKMASSPPQHWRQSLFMCDEFHMIATSGGIHPYGDEKFFSMSREAKCMPIVATQSLSSLKVVLEGDTWKTLFQQFRTRLFLTSGGDDLTGTMASGFAGKAWTYVCSFSVSESGQDAKVSALSGRSHAHKSGTNTHKSWTQQLKARFEPKQLAELPNGVAMALLFDGVDPHPATLLYLKPHYADRSLTYWEQRERGLL